jgi:hypothetical protein
MSGIDKKVLIGLLLLFFIACEHKKFANPHDPLNAPPAPVLVAPQDNSTCFDNPPYFEWETEEDTLNPLYGDSLFYEIQIDDVQEFTDPEYADSLVTYPGAVARFAFGGGDLYWRVRARYKAGTWSEWSSISSFSVVFPLLDDLDYCYGYSIDDMEIDQGKAIISTYGNLVILDISNPYALYQYCEYSDSLGLSFKEISIEGSYLYSVCTSYAGQFSIYSISVPDHPVLINRIDIYNHPQDIYVEANNAYICRGGAYAIEVIDVTNPDSLIIIDSLPTPGNSLVIHNNHAFVTYGGAVVIVDINTNSIISIIHVDASALWVDDHYAFCGSSSLWIFDISDMSSPQLVSIIDQYAFYICANSDYVCMSDGYMTNIYSISDISHPEFIGTLGQCGGHLHTDGTYLYVSSPKFAVIKL